MASLRSAVVPDLLALELAARVGSLQRTLRRRTRAAIRQPGLSPAEAELLRLVADRPQLRVGDAAAALRLAPNTVSTLARRLVGDGLLSSERDENDLRAVRLRLSGMGERRLRRWREKSAHLLAGALEQLSEPERHLLASSLPVLAALVDALEKGEPA